MSSGSIATVVKMLESLLDVTQDQVVEHLRQYLDDIRDEQRWDENFRTTQERLVEKARRAKQEIAQGQAISFNHDQL